MKVTILLLLLFFAATTVPAQASCIPERDLAVIAYDEAKGMPTAPAGPLDSRMAWRAKWRDDNNVKPKVSGQWICGTPQEFIDKWT